MDEASRARIEAIVGALLLRAGAKGADVREELCGHLEDGMRRHLILGKREDEALAAALSDLGGLAPVSASLSGGRRTREARTLLEACAKEGLLETLARAILAGARGDGEGPDN